jgi:uncharacterized protein
VITYLNIFWFERRLLNRAANFAIISFLYLAASTYLMLSKIRQRVKGLADEEDWKYHIVPVVHYARVLAKTMRVDEELAELAALLHDIGRLKFGDADHEITGMVEAEKILKEYHYPQEVIDEIKQCVGSHRGNKENPPTSTLARIIANADAMAHFDVLPLFFYWRAKKESFDEAFRWVDEKIERDWHKKLTLPEAKKLMEEKYKAVRLLLNSINAYR